MVLLICGEGHRTSNMADTCYTFRLYTSDAADDLHSVDLGALGIPKKKIQLSLIIT